jgi:D-glycero-D-manno-heptose 1,7-bisphosphate phosphatase
VVTNQAGIGRGYYTEADFHLLTDWMCEQFAKQGAHIDGVYYCPFHPEYGVGEYLKDSDCRKPAPGMLLQAAREHDIDLKHSVLVGDKPSDIEAGQRAGVGTLLSFGGEGGAADGIPVSRLDDVIGYLDMTRPR